MSRRVTIIDVFTKHRDGLESGMLMECEIASRTTTVGNTYRIRGVFRYVNTYGSGGNKYKQTDVFITIKNDYGYTVKMNSIRFKKYVRPEMTLEERVIYLENQLNNKGIIKIK